MVKEDLIQAISKTYTVGKENYTLPDDIKVKAINYLRTHYFTEDDCLEIMQCIENAVRFANEIGTTDISKISAEDMNRGLSYVQKAAAIAEKAPKLEDVQVSNVVPTKDITKSVEDAHKNSDNVIQDVEQSEIDNIESIETISQNLEDGVDYSKYLSESQYQEIDFENLKESIVDEAKHYSIVKLLPYVLGFIFVLCLIIILCMIKFIKKKNKGGRL